ncbi:spore cortex-lytic enzyme [Marinisporobacter balticus]|uniref:Spore cortex-lytic enzyme n=1 Tax=Marinisporobacter balticus TaxID=2018667 RepID=A0A4R2KW45_9FIRM|nr:spore cortex-lytic enzyme [Marinisporobacter balticus]TCO78741.1 N-acetylmuramoyl-L-alanine amidase [Marinisporobacter balticus]
MKRKTFCISLLLIIVSLCFSLAVDSYFNIGVAQGTLYWGSSGSEVKTLQTKLKNWGYYDGPIDSVFGGGTFEAVKKFQTKNGLTADGVVGAATAEKLGIPTKNEAKEATYQPSSKGAARNDEISLLAKAITGEARGEPYTGQVAVGAVVLNRTRHPSFPNTIAGVIYQPGAFTAVSDGQINLAPAESCVKAAQDALNGWDPTGGCRYYWNPATATSKWIWSRKVIKKIGKHWFGN